MSTLPSPAQGKPRHELGAGLSLLSYFFVLVGFAAIGFSVQPTHPVEGLWLTEALAIALPALLVLRATNVKPGPFLGLATPTWAMLGLALLVAVVNQPAIALLEYVAQRVAPPYYVKLFEQKNQILEAIFAGRKVAMVVTVTIAAPIGEELFFRGFALPALARSLGAPAAVLITGFLFALLHLDPVGFIGLWELGILFGVLRWATGSLWPSVLAHAANNAIAAAAFLFGLQKPDEVPPPWLLWLGAACFAALLPLAVRHLRRPSPNPPREEPWTSDYRFGFHLGRAWGLLTLWLMAVIGGVLALLWQLLQQRSTAA